MEKKKNDKLARMFALSVMVTLVLLIFVVNKENDAIAAALYKSFAGNGAAPVPIILDSTAFVGSASSVAQGADGFPVISYYDATNKRLMFAKCSDAMCASAATSTLDSGGASGVGEYTSIAIGRDGFPVMGYYDQTNLALKFLKCNDASCVGTTIRTLDSGGASGVGQFTSIAIGRDGYPVISYHDDTSFHLKFAKCNDASCSSPTVSTLDSVGSNGTFNSIAIGSDGYPVISYFNQTSFHLKFAKCNDAACSIATTATSTLDSNFLAGIDTSIAIGRDGYPVISYADASVGHLKFAKCNDVACSSPTLSTLDSTAGVGRYTSIAIGTDGYPMISYHDGNNGDLKFAKYVNSGGTGCAVTSWTCLTLDSPGDVGWYTSIANGVDGFPVISYYDNTNHNLKFLHCNGYCGAVTHIKSFAGKGNLPVGTTADPNIFTGTDVSIAQGANGFAAISYRSNGALNFAKCNDVACSSPTINQLDVTSLTGKNTSIAIGRDGFPVISYTRSTGNDLKFAKCNDAACSSSTVSTLDSAGNIAYHTSIAIGSDGFPVIAYYDSVSQDLKFAKCNDAACSSPTLSTLDSVGDVGYMNSVAIGRDGFPVISYIDYTNSLLKFAKCNDVACSSPTLSILDNALNSGPTTLQYTSIAIGLDGNPVISYYNNTTNDLKFAKCNDPACVNTATSTIDSVGDVGTYNSIAIGSDGFPIISYYDNTNHDLKFAKYVRSGGTGCAATNWTCLTLDSVGDVGQYSSIAKGVDGYPILAYDNGTGASASLKFLHCNGVCGAVTHINSSQNNQNTSGLVGEWSFNGKDLSGTTAFDRSGQGNNGTLTNGPTPTIGKIGQALLFDGVNDYLNMGAPSALNITGPFSISAWINPKSFGGSSRGRVVDKFSDDGTTGYGFFVDNVNTTNGITICTGGCVGSAAVISNSNAIQTNTWQHVVVSYNGTTATIYVNGVSVGSGALDPPPSGSNNFYVGNRSATDRAFDGTMDEVRVYNRALSQTEVTQLYNQGR